MRRAGWSLFVALLVPFGLAAQSVTLARRGQPAAVTLVRPAQASPSQVYAAEELQRFTAQLTGVTLPFVSYGGSSLLTSFTVVGLLLVLSERGGRAP